MLKSILKVGLHNSGGNTQREAGSVDSWDTSGIIGHLSQASLRDPCIRFHKVNSKLGVKQKISIKPLPCSDLEILHTVSCCFDPPSCATSRSENLELAGALLILLLSDYA